MLSEDFKSLEIVHGTLTRGSWSNTDSQLTYIVDKTAVLTTASPNVRNVLPLQKSIPQSHRSLGTSLDPGYTEDPLHFVEYGEAGGGREGGFSREENERILELGDVTEQMEKKLCANFPVSFVSSEF